MNHIPYRDIYYNFFNLGVGVERSSGIAVKVKLITFSSCVQLDGRGHSYFTENLENILKGNNIHLEWLELSLYEAHNEVPGMYYMVCAY